MAEMFRDVNGKVIQGFPLKDGQVNLTTGTKTYVSAIACVADGTVTLDDYTGTPTIAMSAGEVYTIDSTIGTGSVTVATGTFHVV